MRCPTCGADPGKACLHLTMERPKPGWPDRKWLDRWRALELVRPHRRRTELFRDTILYREDDHRGPPFRLTEPSQLRGGQLVLVEKYQDGVGTIIVPRKVKRVTERRDGRVFVLFTGRFRRPSNRLHGARWRAPSRRRSSELVSAAPRRRSEQLRA